MMGAGPATRPGVLEQCQEYRDMTGAGKYD